MGCYVCKILLQSNWKPTGKLRSPMPITECIEAIGQEVCGINYRISKNNVKNGAQCFDLSATVVNVKSGHMWTLKLVLVPENGELLQDDGCAVSNNMPTDIEAVVMKRLSPTTSTDSIVQLARNWIDVCQNSHEGCKAQSSVAWRPTRLISVGLDHGIKPRLCVSSMLPQDLRYVTLSHCWGNLAIFKLMSSNFENLMEVLPLEHLTQIFRDAIELTRRLGIHYIWIDSLCIIQDSKEDWAQESAVMGDVYTHCWCNISATGFPDGQAGLCVERDPSFLYPRKFRLDMRDSEVKPAKDFVFSTRPQKHLESPNLCMGKYYLMEDLLHANISMAPLSRRAWVFQERLLSPRVLHIGARQVFWECSKLEACEVFPGGIPGSLSTRFKATTHVVRLSQICNRASKDMISEVFKVPRMSSVWEQVKAGYNDKDLTYHTDKVVAISGLARLMQPLMQDDFVAGFWKGRLLQELLWFCTKLMDRPKPRPEKYQAPSWSWLAVNEIIKDIPLVEPVTPVAKIIECQINPGTSDSTTGFEQITSGIIRIRGPLKRASFVDTDKFLRTRGKKRIDFYNHAIALWSSDGHHLILKPSLWPDNLKPALVYQDMPVFFLRDAIGSRDFYLLPLCYDVNIWAGLILEHTGFKGQYRRIGSWYLPREYNQHRLEGFVEAFAAQMPILEEMDSEDRVDDGECIATII